MPVSRRWFLGALTGAVAAPMIVKTTSIMPIKVMQPALPPGWINYPISKAIDNLVFPDMAFSIEKVCVTAKSRRLSANWTMELSQDLKYIHNIDAEEELTRILADEINRDIIRQITVAAKQPYIDPGFLKKVVTKAWNS